MLQDVISSHDQLSIDDITSPFSAQLFDYCDPQLFQETFNQTSEVTSVSNILEKSGSFQENHSGNSNTNTTTTTENSNNNKIKLQDDDDDNNLSIIFDSQEDFENDITASIDFSSSSLQYPVIDHLLSTTNESQFDFSSGVQVINQPTNILYSEDSLSLPAVSSLAPPPLQLGVFEEDRLSSVPSYNLGFNPSCSFFRTPGLPAYMMNMSTGLSSSENNSDFFTENIHLGSKINKPLDQMMDFQADNGGLFGPDSIKRIFNPGNLQALGSVESQSHLVAPQDHSVLGSVEINGLEDSTLNKVGKLTAEQRKEKIRRYMKKRNERNFNKKIKYACRKTLADSRPRVRGRFAKNDEFGEPNIQASSSHHDDEDEDYIGVKDEEQLVDSSDIFSHISGANSFKCNYPIQSWI